MAVRLSSGDPRAAALTGARRALEEGRGMEAAAAYRELLAAVEADASAAALRRALWVEHAGRLAARGELDDAAAVLRAYLGDARARADAPGLLALHVLLAEVRAAQGDWRGMRSALAEAEALRPDAGPAHADAARPALLRLAGLDAAERGEREEAFARLDAARRAYAARRDTRGVRVVDGDLRRLSLEGGSAAAVGEVLAQAGTRSTSELLLQARALRRDARYEAAVQLLAARLEREVEPALRFPLLHELVLLHLLLAQWERAERLVPLLREAALLAGDPDEARAAVDRLCGGASAGTPAGTGFEGRLHQARALARQERFAEAAGRLEALRPEATSARRDAAWSFAAGELAFARGVRAEGEERPDHAGQAQEQLGRAAWLAWRHSLPELYGEALRLLGRVHDELRGDRRTAEGLWALAERAEETIAHRQETDAARIRYLDARPSAFDQRIEAAAARVSAADGRTAALPIVAMEEARGTAILSLVLPLAARRPRELPPMEEVEACWQWCRRTALALPKDLAFWLVHATPGRLHHALVARGLVHTSSVPVDRLALTREIDELERCWHHGVLLKELVAATPERVTGPLQALAGLMRPGAVLEMLPDRITRLAVVAAGALNDIPFCALPLAARGGEARPLVTRFALSRHPCLSTWPPLEARARAARGDHGLHVRPPGERLERADPAPGSLTLDGADATVRRLDALLRERARPLVQIDGHGEHDAAHPLESWLALAPAADDDGRLTAARLQELALEGCGTLLLGACESGMTQRVGRDERIGFVRAGLAAGAASVLAAQWVAEDGAARFILARFGEYLRFLPRDRALQRAQLDFLGLPPGHALSGALPGPRHPAWWACWTLHGDPGLQTRAGWLLRTARRGAAALRPRTLTFLPPSP